MKRSRASLMLFLMTLCCALHTVGWASSPRAATIDVGPLQRLCTADWSPLGDCYAGAPQPATTLAANANVTLVNSSLLNACHPEALSCYYQACADYTSGVDCFGSPVVAVSHETDAYPIEEYVYGDPAVQDSSDVAYDSDHTDCYGEYGCDEFDCDLVYQPKIYREDLSKLASDPRHSTGQQLAIDINANNDGLAEGRLASIRQSVAPRVAANVGANYDYGDCSDACHEDGGLNSAADRLVHDLEDLCGAGHCLIQSGVKAPVVTIDEEPLDLPPVEPAVIDPTEYGYEFEYNYEDDYSYGYEDDYTYGYQDDYSDGATSQYESADAGEDYGYGYSDDEQYVYEGSQEPTDLPPGEQFIDDLPPGEQLTDAVSSREPAPAQASYDYYDVQCYGDYRDTPEATKAWIEPGCDEQQGYAAEDWCDGLSDDERSWGVGREYRKTALRSQQQSREVLRSTARLLNRLGESLLTLAKSLDDQVEPVAESLPQSMMPVEEMYPWPATIGRHPKIDPPLGL